MRLKLITVGLIWQSVLAMIILYREEGNMRLATISRRFWLNLPVSPRTGATMKALWWWIIPLILLVAFVEIGVKPVIVELWTAILPLFAEPKGYDFSGLLSPELRAQWVGAWGLFGPFFVFALFNTALGEEFLFRGVLFFLFLILGLVLGLA